MPMRKTTIEINEELLERVRGALGTTTLKETVDEAFREVLRERARREEVDALSTMRGMDLDADDIMAGAWRPRRSPRSGSCCTTTPTSTESPR
jgi:Arc/MetJ family transcription regulator